MSLYIYILRYRKSNYIQYIILGIINRPILKKFSRNNVSKKYIVKKCIIYNNTSSSNKIYVLLYNK